MHNYFIKYSNNQKLDDCAICLLNLQQNPQTAIELSEPVI